MNQNENNQELDLNALMKIRKEKLDNLKAEGKNPFEITKFEVREDKEYVFVTVGSGNKNGEIAQKLLKLEIEGFEFASGIPRNNWWSCKNECWCLWQRNERYSDFYFIYG